MKRSMLMLTGCAALMFTACGGKGTDNGQPDGNGGGSTQPTQPTTLNVSGKVMSEDGKPLSNATVFVLGKTSVTSDASGTFSVADVKPPYDIVAVSSNKEAAIIYKGVTRKDPTLSLPGPEGDATSMPTLSGKLTGLLKGARTPSNTVSDPVVKFVTASSSDTRSSFNKDDASFSADVEWDTGTALSGTLFAFQGERDPDSFALSKFTGFGRRDNVTLGNGATLGSQDITLGTVANSSLTGKLSVSDGLMPFLTSVDMQFSPESTLQVQSVLGASNAFSYAVPVVSQTTFDITTIAFGKSLEEISVGSKRGLAAGATVNLDLKALPALQQPADKATDVGRSTEFSWTGTSGGVHFATLKKKIEPAMATEKPFTLVVITSESRTRIPDLSTLGMALPASADFTWFVGSYSPLSSVDAALVNLTKNGPVGINEFYAARSAPREFKTAATP